MLPNKKEIDALRKKMGKPLALSEMAEFAAMMRKKNKEGAKKPYRWIDEKTGRKYKDIDVEFRDVDNPGAQFAGWITRESGQSDCINKWVCVSPIEKKK